MLTSAAGAAAAFVLAGYKSFAVTDIGSHRGAVGAQLTDLNPDRMWPVYRRYHLLIVGQRDDERGNGFAAAVADVLARFLPASRAMLVRAADARRIGVLIATDQQDVGVMTSASAEALFLSKPPFEDIRDAPLRVIVSFGSHVLVCRPNFMARHAYLMAKTLAEHDDVDALWYHGSQAGTALVERASAGNLKPVWSFGGKRVEWHADFEGQGTDYLRHCLQIKNIWVPYGE